MTVLEVCGEGWAGGRKVCVELGRREKWEGIARISELDPEGCAEPENGVTATLSELCFRKRAALLERH